MRLHRLEVRAFGPFADTVTVDFDALSEAGLFLFTGPTGAGKTSVLDAVCFALYGDVPGDRAGARSLRSDHAPEGRAPLVVLECTLAGRRLRIDRSPAWRRPKKRGTGTTPEQARVTLSERRDGAWAPLSTRLDETGHLLTGLLGMNLGQFTQVAMLPQGEFQAFLRAGADSRQQLLERLFRTARFRGVEGWLAERRRELGRACREHEQRVHTTLARTAEVLEQGLPPEWEERGLAEVAEAGLVADWLAARADGCAEAVRATARRHSAAERAAATAARALADAQNLAARQARHRRAVEEASALAGQEPQQEDRRRALERAGRAAPVLPLVRAVERASRAAVGAREAARREAALVADLTGDGDCDLRREQELARATVARIEAALPRADLLRRLREQDEADGRALAGLERDRVALLEERDALPAGLVAAEERLVAAAEAAARRVGAEQALAAGTGRLEAAELVPALEAELAAAAAARQQAVDDLHRAREAWLTVREERLTGMAAEIATRLAVGAECPVCGSAEHPHPARPRDGAPDAAAEKAARRVVDDAEAVREAARDHERGVERRLEVARQACGGADAEELTSLVSRLRGELDELTRTVADADPARAERDGLRRRIEETTESLADLGRRRERLEAVAQARAQQVDEIAAEVDALLAGSGLTDLSDLRRRHRALVEACEAAIAARAEEERTTAALDDAEEHCAEALHAAGFDDADDAVDAALEETERTALERDARRHDDRLAAVRALLADPELVAAAELPPPDLATLGAAAEAAAEELAGAGHRAATAAGRARRVTALVAEVRTALDRWCPLRDEHALTSSLAAFAEGKAGDNRLQMRLSAYVLAARLGEVVDAANERLRRMSDDRYLLEHTGHRGAGDRRGGLGLLVRDAWSGQTRDPATLSGGETFIVSLALALGLSDVVSHEAGGARLDTLFVDEGFGSLDQDTLEDVLATLDGLRSGGRVVGVVSHVAEMRDRIPAQVRLVKSPAGSRLTQTDG